MKTADSYFKPGDEEHLILLWKELHRHPELGMNLPETVKIVKKELTDIGIPFTEEFGKGSVVAEIGEKSARPVIALRADMDALPIEEKCEDEYRSQNPGRMHACGHDSHTAMLLAAARALKRAWEEGVLTSRVKLLFQPSEETDPSGAQMMVKNGVLKDVDYVFGQHVDPAFPTGTFAFCDGPLYAGSRSYDITFTGKSSHATVPQAAADPLAMAVRAYEGIYLMKCRMIGPFEENIISVSSLHAGTCHNIIPDTAEMKISVRFYDPGLDRKIREKIHKICEDAAEEFGGSVFISDDAFCPALCTEKEMNEIAKKAAVLAAGTENIVETGRDMASEDCSWFLEKCPGTYSLLGVRNEEKGYTEQLHNSRFHVDEKALLTGSRYFAQLALMF